MKNSTNQKRFIAVSNVQCLLPMRCLYAYYNIFGESKLFCLFIEKCTVSSCILSFRSQSIQEMHTTNGRLSTIEETDTLPAVSICNCIVFGCLFTRNLSIYSAQLHSAHCTGCPTSIEIVSTMRCVCFLSECRHQTHPLPNSII